MDYIDDYRWKDMTFRRWWAQFRTALVLMDWSPRRWALHHDDCKDLTFAWWLAGLVLDRAEEEAIRRLILFIELSTDEN